MKKIWLGLLTMFLCFTVFSQAIDVKSAQWYAERWSSLSKQKTLNDLQCVYTQSDETNSQNYFYIFNSISENSFIIISADERILPVLAYSDEGAFDLDDFPLNMQNWLNGYVEEMESVFSRSDVEKHPEWNNIHKGEVVKGTNAVEPLINLHWNQSPYYNHFCPGNCTAGCVATAMSMIMKYWNHPVHGFGQSSYYYPPYGTLSANYGETYYEWEQMPIQATSSDYLAIATLMYHCGVSVEMMYCSDGTASGAYTSDVVGALVNYFGYQTQCRIEYKDSYSTSQWENMMRAELDLGRPMEYSGHGSGGHAFVLDGYDDNNKFHFNWGWGGSANGYFTLDNLNPSGQFFSEWQGAVMNIEPNWTPFCPSPTNLRVVYNAECEAQLTWNMHSPIEIYYNVYRDTTLIAERILETSYIDQDFATHVAHTWKVVGICNNNDETVPAVLTQNPCPYESPTITTILPNGTVGEKYSQALSATGVTPMTWSLLSGELPSGLFFYPTGTLYGTPTEAGVFDFLIQASNNWGNDTKDFSLTIEEGVGISENNLSKINVYPNPASSELRITNYELQAENYRIFSVVGQMVMEGKLQDAITTISVKSLANGMYYLRIGDEVVRFLKEGN